MSTRVSGVHKHHSYPNKKANGYDSDCSDNDPTKKADGYDSDCSGSDGELHDSFICPITQDVMSDPVILVVNSQSYERSALERWFATESRLSPLTDYGLRYVIEEYAEETRNWKTSKRESNEPVSAEESSNINGDRSGASNGLQNCHLQAKLSFVQRQLQRSNGVGAGGNDRSGWKPPSGKRRGKRGTKEIPPGVLRQSSSSVVLPELLTWLTDIGCQRFAQKFVDAGCDTMTAWQYHTESDLEEFGAKRIHKPVILANFIAAKTNVPIIDNGSSSKQNQIQEMEQPDEHPENEGTVIRDTVSAVAPQGTSIATAFGIPMAVLKPLSNCVARSRQTPQRHGALPTSTCRSRRSSSGIDRRCRTAAARFCWWWWRQHRGGLGVAERCALGEFGFRRGVRLLASPPRRTVVLSTEEQGQHRCAIPIDVTGARTCDLGGNNIRFTDPWQGTVKYLQVSYDCIKTNSPRPTRAPTPSPTRPRRRQHRFRRVIPCQREATTNTCTTPSRRTMHAPCVYWKAVICRLFTPKARFARLSSLCRMLHRTRIVCGLVLKITTSAMQMYDKDCPCYRVVNFMHQHRYIDMVPPFRTLLGLRVCSSKSEVLQRHPRWIREVLSVYSELECY